MADSQSSKEEVRGVNSKERGTGPRKGSTVSFLLDPHDPSSTFINKRKNMLKTRRAKPDEKLVQGKPHPSHVPNHTLMEFWRMEEAQGPALERRITHPWVQASKPEEMTIKENEEIQEQNNKQEEATKSEKSSSSSPGKEVIRDKKDKEKDDLLKDEELMVYLSTINEAVSAILLVERNRRQVPIHYVSRVLQEDNPTHTRVAEQEETPTEGKIQMVRRTTEDQVPTAPSDETNLWKLYTDRASNDYGSGAGLILIDPERIEYSYALRLNFTNSNNYAEYEALPTGLRIAAMMKVEKIHAFVDLKLVAN
uniref:Uncharacterized protein n=1 Tax=Tanacetum cinerariifolium TaxID=118510 RepID=A0A6L2N849_TANCI|nr:hypothetical protein [Tanacetum cinerariifolium]